MITIEKMIAIIMVMVIYHSTVIDRAVTAVACIAVLREALILMMTKIVSLVVMMMKMVIMMMMVMMMMMVTLWFHLHG